jgi:hypothetical protein
VLVRESQGDKRLVAYVVLKEQQTATPQELQPFLQSKLPSHMVPAAFLFLAALPLTPSGKIDQRALPTPDSFERGADEAYVAPRTPVEELVAAIWSQALGVDQIGVHDNFFQLGGHSLLITRVLAQVADLFQVQLLARVFFETPTVAGVAAALVQHESRPRQVETIARLRKRLSAMSATEVQQALQARKAA